MAPLLSKRGVGLLKTGGYLGLCAAGLAIGLWLVLTGAHHAAGPQFDSLPFGCFVASGAGLLLAGRGIEKECRRAGRCGGRSKAPAPPPAAARLPPAPHATTLSALANVLELPLDAPPATGLSSSEAAARLAAYGANALPPAPFKPLWSALLDEVHEPQQLLLQVVGVLYTLVGEVEEGAMALGVIALMVAAEVVTEWRAKRALASLASSAPEYAAVLRDGAATTVPRSNVVPGDVLLLKAGFTVPADARLLTAAQLQCAEASLTGEAVPVHKSIPGGGGSTDGPAAVLPAATPLAERSNMLFSGALVTRGVGTALVTATGLCTELGRLHALSGAAAAAKKAKDKKTPLQALLRSVAGRLTWVALCASITGGLLGLARHMPWQAVVLTALSLAFATIPEELPILIAAVLAIGARSLAAGGVFVKRLRAMECLAHIDVLLTDKTGTLTCNVLQLVGAVAVQPAGSEPAVGAIDLSSGSGATASAPALSPLLAAWALSSASTAAAEGGEDAAGGAFLDPFDAAVLRRLPALLSRTGVKLSPVETGELPPLSTLCGGGGASLRTETPFDQTTKTASRELAFGTPAASSNGAPAYAAGPLESAVAALRASLGASTELTVVKGAPEAVLERCLSVLGAGGLTDALRSQLLEEVGRTASDGRRMVAYAAGAGSADFTFVGVLCYADPLRPEVPSCVAQLHAAGVRVVMLTGDHPQAAAAIARRAGILGGHASGSNAARAAQSGKRSLDLAAPLLADSESASSYESTAVTVGQDATAGVVHCAIAELSAPSASSDADRSWADALLASPAAAASPPLVYARATPAHKHALVTAYQAAGHTVAVTGDGVNDAPALAAADAGIAVAGATDVARGAAPIVVVGDGGDFSALLRVLSEGRRLRDNLGHALAFYLGAKLGLVSLFVVGTLWQGFPMAPVQVIVLELFMDVGASTSFVAEPAEAGVMARPPLPRGAPFFDRVMLARIAAGGLSMGGSVVAAIAFGAYGPMLPGGGAPVGPAGDPGSRSRALAFVVWLLAHVVLAYNQRTATKPVCLSKPALGNRALLAWAGAVVLLSVAVGTVPGAQSAVDVPPLSPADWGVAVAIALAGTCWIEAVKLAAAGWRAVTGREGDS